MSVPPTVNDLLARNKEYDVTFPKLSELPAVPSTVIVSCADPRVIPEKIFNLDYGEAIVFRCVAGHPQTGFKDLLALDQFARFKECMVIHHVDCGSRYFSDEDVRSDIQSRGRVSEEELEALGGFGTLGKEVSPEESVKNDVTWLKSQKALRPELAQNVRGFVFDIKGGRVTEVTV